MADNRPLSTAILHQNGDKTIVLLDVPKSITIAQGTPENPCNDDIYSSRPLEVPYPSTEPNSEKAKASVLRTKVPSDAEAHFPKHLLYQAIEEIASHWQGEWCLTRKISPFTAAGQSRKRKFLERGDPGPSSQGQDTGHDPHQFLPIPGRNAVEISAMHPSTTEPDLRVSERLFCPGRFSEPLILFADPMHASHICPDIQNIVNKLVRNPHGTPLSLIHAETSFKVPPNASFLMAEISEAMAPIFSMGALTMYPEPSATADPGQFDFILLDPPWENRSVRRSAKYDTMRDTDIMVVLQSLLGQHISRDGLVACWVTNNSRVRAVALEAFAAWEVQLIEEWAWLKTTVHGVPVSKIDGVWRQPYEILLLGRRMEAVATHPANLGRRVIVAVPDLHSRKPNLKELVEPMMPAHYRALEIFSRNLSARWCVWGDEVVKFNWEGHWSQK